jgi:3-isopropylmalate/(R)-2-methylmalate dehydratase small subunit
MRAFTTLTAIAAPLPLANVDTDKIIPARFLKTIRRTGLGRNLFDTLRYDENGAERPDFVLNQEPWRHAEILIAHENFGCGSSREHAPWALLDFGIRCVIAPDFADIFYSNTFKNGILPITLPRAVCDALMDEAQRILRPNGEQIAFTIDPFRRHLLLNGLDDIGQTLQHQAAIDTYEQRVRAEHPWLPALATV